MKLRVTMLLNIGGRAGAMAIGIVVVPVYLHLLGLAGVGLIAFYTAVYGIAAVIDQTLSTVLIRETSRYRNLEHGPQFTRDLLRTMEGVTLGIGAVIFAATLAFNTQIATVFLGTSPLAGGTLAHCITMMGGSIAIQLLLALQANMASALERADLSNGLTLAATILRAALSISALLTIERSVEVYFAAQLTALAATLVASTWLIWRALPRANRVKPRLSLLSDAMRYLPGLFGSASLFVAITQVDKLVVAKMLTIDDLGRYYLAGTVASMIWAPLAPIHLTLMPRLSTLIEQREELAVRDLVHIASQFLTTAIVPAAVLTALFSEQILFLWTGHTDVAREAAPILSVLAIGTGLWTLAGVPNVLQFAAGSARFSLAAGLVGVLLIPFGALASRHLGAVGPALVLVGAAAAQIFILPIGIFRKLRMQISGTWYARDIGLQIFTAGLIGGVIRQFPIGATDRLTIAIELLAYFALLTIAVLIVSVELRRAVIAYVKALSAGLTLKT